MANTKKKIVSISEGMDHAEDALNNVLEKIQDFEKFDSFKEKIKYFSKELSCYLFFNKTLDDMRATTEGKEGFEHLESILDEITVFLAKIGSLYVKITDFDGDGKPILDITKARFVEENGRYVLSLDDVLDYDDVDIIEGKINEFASSIREKNTEKAISVAIESIMGIITYSYNIYSEVKAINISQAFNNIFIKLQSYPKVVSENFRFKTVPALATSLVFSGIMLFVWIGLSKIPDISTREGLMSLLKNDFVKGQINSSVDIIVRAISGEDLTGVKLCGCIPLCCKGDVNLQESTDDLQDELDFLMASSEVTESHKTDESDKVSIGST